MAMAGTTGTPSTRTDLGGRFFAICWGLLLILGVLFYVFVLPPLVADKYGNAKCWNYYVFLHRFALTTTLLYTATYYFRAMRVFRFRDSLHKFFWGFFLLFIVAFLYSSGFYIADFLVGEPILTSLVFVRKHAQFLDLWGPIILASVLIVCDFQIWRLAEMDTQSTPAEIELYRQTVILVDLPVLISTFVIKLLFWYENQQVVACIPTDVAQLTEAKIGPYLAYAFFGGAHAFQFFAFNIIFLFLLLRHRWPERSPAIPKPSWRAKKGE